MYIKAKQESPSPLGDELKCAAFLYEKRLEDVVILVAWPVFIFIFFFIKEPTFHYPRTPPSPSNLLNFSFMLNSSPGSPKKHFFFFFFIHLEAPPPPHHHSFMLPIFICPESLPPFSFSINFISSQFLKNFPPAILKFIYFLFLSF